MRTARLGVVGVGRWGGRLVDTVARAPGARLAAVATSRPQARAFPAGCALVESWEDLLARDDLDGVALAIPPTLHRTVTLAALERGLPVLVEKPLATTVVDAVAVVAAAERHARPVVVDHTHLWSPAFVALAALAGPGPLTIEGVGGATGPFGRAVDPLWDWGPHDVAMTLALTGAAPHTVRAVRHDDPATGGSVTEMELRFARGDVARLRVGNAMAAKRRELRVRTPAGRTLVYDDLAAPKLTRDDGAGLVGVDVAPDLPLDRVVGEFAELVTAGAAHHPSVKLGVEVVRVLAATGIPA